jgi:predicted phosphodiesterase
MTTSEPSRRHPAPRRIAILSDPHGDLVAPEKVISDLETAGPVDEVLVGGDLAQGGAQPAEVVDLIRGRGWPSVRGNADDLLVRLAGGSTPEQALRAAKDTHESLPESVASHALWAVSRLGPERIEYLRSLPTSLVRGPYAFGTVVLVHATPWSTEDVVLPDAGEEVAERMARESGARLLVYGHIHTQYVRRVGDAVLMSVGAVSGSNDADPRPAYMILELGETISVEPRRVDCPPEERPAAYIAAGVEPRFSRHEPGPFPVRCRPGVAMTVWP